MERRLSVRMPAFGKAHARQLSADERIWPIVEIQILDCGSAGFGFLSESNFEPKCAIEITIDFTEYLGEVIQCFALTEGWYRVGVQLMRAVDVHAVVSWSANQNISPDNLAIDFIKEITRTFERSFSLIYVVNKNLKINYCNQALEKSGLLNVDCNRQRSSRTNVLPRGELDFLEVVSIPLRPFYERRLSLVGESGQSAVHDLECCSEMFYRVCRVTIMPFAISDGYCIISSLLNSRRHSRKEITRPKIRDYVGPDQNIQMCSHCLKTLSTKSSEWDWVPQFLIAPPDSVRQTLCPQCKGYFFPRDWECHLYQLTINSINEECCNSSETDQPQRVVA